MSPLAELFLAVFAAVSGLPHPHVPKAVTMHGAGGPLTLYYQTVDYNPTHMENLQPGFSWFLAFANLRTEIPLTAGGANLPAGHYKLNMVRGETARDWSLEVVDFEYYNLQTQVQRLRRRGMDSGDAFAAAEARLDERVVALEEQGVPERVLLDTEDFRAADAVHLDLGILNRGHAIRSLRRDQSANGGAEFELRFSFGPLHKSVAFREVFAGGQKR